MTGLLGTPKNVTVVLAVKQIVLALLVGSHKVLGDRIANYVRAQPLS